MGAPTVELGAGLSPAGRTVPAELDGAPPGGIAADGDPHRRGLRCRTSGRGCDPSFPRDRSGGPTWTARVPVRRPGRSDRADAEVTPSTRTWLQPYRRPRDGGSATRSHDPDGNSVDLYAPLQHYRHAASDLSGTPARAYVGRRRRRPGDRHLGGSSPTRRAQPPAAAAGSGSASWARTRTRVPSPAAGARAQAAHSAMATELTGRAARRRATATIAGRAATAAKAGPSGTGGDLGEPADLGDGPPVLRPGPAGRQLVGRGPRARRRRCRAPKRGEPQPPASASAACPATCAVVSCRHRSTGSRPVRCQISHAPSGGRVRARPPRRASRSRHAMTYGRHGGTDSATIRRACRRTIRAMTDRLDEYRRKRDATRTPEPVPRGPPAPRPGRPVRHPAAPRPQPALGRPAGARRRAGLVRRAARPAARPQSQPPGQTHRGPPAGVPGLPR